LEELSKDAAYDMMDTCATDGMCAEKCPVGINTGALIKLLREESQPSITNAIALFLAKQYQYTTTIVRLLLVSKLRLS
jgi:D-lactate dehydrogenase